jgi:Cof subfamily protein (haloacid dehalogenase superfamily)
MNRKYIFFDLDGTLISHEANGVLESTLYTLNELQKNGHTCVIATGRPPALFFGIDKELGIDSYIGSNGAIVVHKGNVLFNNPIPKETVQKLVDYAKENGLDIGFESDKHFCIQSKNTDLVDLFCEVFHLPEPPLLFDHHKTNDIYQMVLFYDQPDFKKFEDMFDGLLFNYSNPYGLDVNKEDGLKDVGLKIFKEHFDIDIDDIIAVGDGFNDISMLEYAGTGIAMGNASKVVQEHADIVADHIKNDGLYKVFVELGLIKSRPIK